MTTLFETEPPVVAPVGPMIRVIQLPEHPKWQSPKAWIELVDDEGNAIANGTIYPPKTLKDHFGAGEHDPILYGIYRMLWLHRFYKNVRECKTQEVC